MFNIQKKTRPETWTHDFVKSNKTYQTRIFMTTAFSPILTLLEQISVVTRIAKYMYI